MLGLEGGQLPGVVLRFPLCLPSGLPGPAQLRLDPLPALVHGIQHPPVKQALEQPHENREIDQLCADGEPVDEHASWSAGNQTKGLAKMRIIETTKQ